MTAVITYYIECVHQSPSHVELTAAADVVCDDDDDDDDIDNWCSTDISALRSVASIYVSAHPVHGT